MPAEGLQLGAGAEIEERGCPGSFPRQEHRPIRRVGNAVQRAIPELPEDTRHPKAVGRDVPRVRAAVVAGTVTHRVCRRLHPVVVCRTNPRRCVVAVADGLPASECGLDAVHAGGPPDLVMRGTGHRVPGDGDAVGVQAIGGIHPRGPGQGQHILGRRLEELASQDAEAEFGSHEPTAFIRFDLPVVGAVRQLGGRAGVGPAHRIHVGTGRQVGGKVGAPGGSARGSVEELEGQAGVSGAGHRKEEGARPGVAVAIAIDGIGPGDVREGGSQRHDAIPRVVGAEGAGAGAVRAGGGLDPVVTGRAGRGRAVVVGGRHLPTVAEFRLGAARTGGAVDAVVAGAGDAVPAYPDLVGVGAI